MLGSSPLGLAFLWLLPFRGARAGGRQEKEKASRWDREGTPLFSGVLAVLSVGSGEPFPPGQLQIPLKQGSVSAPAQLYHLPGGDQKVQRPGCHGSSGTAGRDEASCATGWLRPGEEEKVAVFSLSNHLNFIVMIVFI